MAVLYFAFGSNLLPARLLARCPSARPIQTAVAHGFELRFTKPSVDGSGKATLVASTSGNTPGAIFEIADHDIDALDRAEGAGKGYDRFSTFEVRSQNSSSLISVTCYLASIQDDARMPYDWYLALIIAGALHYNLPQEHVANLRSTRYVPDAQLERPARAEALELLNKSGFQDVEHVLAG